MKSQRFLILLILLAAVSGCHSVTSPYLLGDKPAVLSPEAWNGRWGPECSGEEAVQMEVLDKDKGILKAVPTNPREEPEVVTCYLRTAGDLMFVNAKLAKEPDYHPWLIKNESGKMLILWSPDYDKFKHLVEKGILPGEAQGGDVSLGLLKSEHLDIILSDKAGVLFDWKHPMVLIRQTEKPAPPAK
ncbi:MAG: hypothetical protein WAW37_03385 [Syntrophobacteraceae bacterium]